MIKIPINIERIIFFVLYIDKTIHKAAKIPAKPSLIIDGEIRAISKDAGKESKKTFIFPSCANLFDNNKPEILKLYVPNATRAIINNELNITFFFF